MYVRVCVCTHTHAHTGTGSLGTKSYLTFLSSPSTQCSGHPPVGAQQFLEDRNRDWLLWDCGCFFCFCFLITNDTHVCNSNRFSLFSCWGDWDRMGKVKLKMEIAIVDLIKEQTSWGQFTKKNPSELLWYFHLKHFTGWLVSAFHLASWRLRQTFTVAETVYGYSSCFGRSCVHFPPASWNTLLKKRRSLGLPGSASIWQNS